MGKVEEMKEMGWMDGWMDVRNYTVSARVERKGVKKIKCRRISRDRI